MNAATAEVSEFAPKQRVRQDRQQQLPQEGQQDPRGEDTHGEVEPRLGAYTATAKQTVALIDAVEDRVVRMQTKLCEDTEASMRAFKSRTRLLRESVVKLAGDAGEAERVLTVMAEHMHELTRSIGPEIPPTLQHDRQRQG